MTSSPSKSSGSSSSWRNLFSGGTFSTTIMQPENPGLCNSWEKNLFSKSYEIELEPLYLICICSMRLESGNVFWSRSCSRRILFLGMETSSCDLLHPAELRISKSEHGPFVPFRCFRIYQECLHKTKDIKQKHCLPIQVRVLECGSCRDVGKICRLLGFSLGKPTCSKCLR